MKKAIISIFLAVGFISSAFAQGNPYAKQCWTQQIPGSINTYTQCR